jgi:hypothetical protein
MEALKGHSTRILHLTDRNIVCQVDRSQCGSTSKLCMHAPVRSNKTDTTTQMDKSTQLYSLNFSMKPNNPFMSTNLRPLRSR